MTTADPRELRHLVDGLCRRDFLSFAIRAFPILEAGNVDLAPHFSIICRFLEKVHEGEIRRGLVCIPPRYLKTYLVTIVFTAWLLGKNPKIRIICAAYGMPLAEKFNADTLKLMQSAWYKRIFPGTRINPRKQGKTEFETTAGGYRLATSVGGTITGRGADLIIVDDPLKAGEAHSPTARRTCIDWFNGSVHTRFNHPKQGRIIVVAQRLHAEDLPGHLLEVGGWEPLILPAVQARTQVFDIVKGGRKARFKAGRILQPSRHDADDLAQLRREMGEHDFEAQFNQCPLPPGGATFKEEWIKRYDELPGPARIEAIIQSLDTAYEGDEGNSYTVCTTWAKCPDGYYLLHVWRDRPSFPALHKKVLDLKAEWKASMVIVEKKASGISLIETLEQSGRVPWLVNISPEKGKVERAQQQSLKFEQGKVWLPVEAEWLPAYEAELFSFPHCKFDDQVDSTVQLLAASDYSSFHTRLRALR
ncbi:phage terminase large subunit [Caenibius sp. WL]|uniref:phage terminase large subunit n=1 Tax=Caenibius sp. WL TaxID=2872646 RepID=UPI001C98F58A|nr:phage terminase large subunit [Caenibius sp. WL]QZP07728.1 phage terminase large subunit [Caenibius sp. WL]